MSQTSLTAVETAAEAILSLARQHACYSHPLFERLRTVQLSLGQAAALLRNYDAHASVLRRLLLRAASVMPEPAVGFVLENVRNEYGNGDYSRNHQFQLIDVAIQCGVSRETFDQAPITDGVKRFIADASSYYTASAEAVGERDLLEPAVVAGAITATEILAIEEFRALQIAFTPLGQKHHIWFHHVTIEAEHTDESLALALHFADTKRGMDSVKFGLNGILDANMHLYDGLLETIS